MDEERKQRWVAHCHRLAEMTYAIADWCEDPEMMTSYVALGGRWVQIAAEGPKGNTMNGRGSPTTERPKSLQPLI